MRGTGLMNTAWMLACMREAGNFRRATRAVERTQHQLLMALLRRNQETRFGQSHRFQSVASYHDYRQAVPLSRYESYAMEMEEIAQGRSGILTRDPVELLEPTSGSSGGEKLIPFTRGFRRQFQRAVSTWIYDLFKQRPALRRGRAYWSISPGIPARRSAGGVPIGFADDAAYLGAAQQWMLRRLLVVPPEITRLKDMRSFRYCTLWYLLGAADLALISVWSPTFLLTLLEPLQEWQEQLCRDLERGWPQPPEPPPTDALLQHLAQRPRPDPSRAHALRDIFRSPLPPSEILRRVWPKLALISSWADVSAGPYHAELRKLFPAVEHQPKGLLATEGFVSIPLLGQPAPALAIRSHFFEFQETDSGEIRLAHQLDRGRDYRVILTTAGGLYRYELRDEVQVVDFTGQCPLLRFVGKADGVSDLVGEKLAEPFCRAVVTRLFAAPPHFAMLVPVADRPPHYRLYVQDAALSTDGTSNLSAQLNAGLRENPHYAYALALGQLAPADVVLLDPRGPIAWAVFERQCLARGMRAGNIKPTLLERWAGWPALFAAQFPAAPPPTPAAPTPVPVAPPPAPAAAQIP